MKKLTIETTYRNDIKGIAKLPKYSDSKDETMFIRDVVRADTIHRLGYKENGIWVGTEYLVTVDEDLSYALYNLTTHTLVHYSDSIALGWPDIINEID